MCYSATKVLLEEAKDELRLQPPDSGYRSRGGIDMSGRRERS